MSHQSAILPLIDYWRLDWAFGRLFALLLAIEIIWIITMAARLPEDCRAFLRPRYPQDRIVTLILWLIACGFAAHLTWILYSAYHPRAG